MLRDSIIEQVLSAVGQLVKMGVLFPLLSSLLFSSPHNRPEIDCFNFVPDTEANIMAFAIVWLSFWTAVGSIAAAIVACPVVWRFIRSGQPPDPAPDPALERLTEIRNALQGIRDDQRAAFDDLRGCIAGLEVRFQACEATVTASAEATVRLRGLIEEEQRQRNAQSERAVVPVSQGPLCTLM